MTLSRRAILLTALLTVTISGCEEQAATKAADSRATRYVVAVNNPLAYFARRLVGDAVDIRLLAAADTDPAQWQPSVEDVLQLQQADLVLLNGAGYSAWLNKVSLSDNKLAVTSEAARDQWLELDGEVTHSHGPGGEHAHGGYAFTTWMDMNLAQVQASSVAAALERRWPEKRAAINDNLASLLTDIKHLDGAYLEASARLRSRDILYSHPVYQYFEHRYGLPGKSLHWEPDVMPDERQWQALQSLISAGTLFIWEAQPSAEIARRMQTMGIPYVVVDPAANEGHKDWLTVQRQNVARLKESAQP